MPLFRVARISPLLGLKEKSNSKNKDRNGLVNSNQNNCNSNNHNGTLLNNNNFINRTGSNKKGLNSEPLICSNGSPNHHQNHQLQSAINTTPNRQQAYQQPGHQNLSPYQHQHYPVGVVPSGLETQFSPSHHQAVLAHQYHHPVHQHQHQTQARQGQHHQLPIATRQPQQPQLAFYCQLAHGSSTALISGFGNVRELYQKIAEAFDIVAEDILFCTLNTHKVEMSELVGGQIGLDDFIYAHRKGRPKEIELIKIDDALGLTLTDNGAGYVFIKRIRENSVMDKLKVVQVGDHIEKINGQSLVGKKHFEVAKMLKDIERGSQFTLRLIEPLSRSGFGIIGPRSSSSSSSRRGKFIPYGTGKETLRFKADGYARIEKMVENEKEILHIEKINSLLDRYMGICDNELARRLWEIAEHKINSMDLAKAIESLIPESFNFSDDFIFDVWKIAFEARHT